MSHSRKDTVGGHSVKGIEGGGGIWTDTAPGKRFAKRYGRRQLRRDEKRITAQAYRNYQFEIEEEQNYFYELIERDFDDPFVNFFDNFFEEEKEVIIEEPDPEDFYDPFPYYDLYDCR